MNSKQVAELAFWQGLCNRETATEFQMRRMNDAIDNFSHYDKEGAVDLKGNGLEVGTGCYSQLESFAVKDYNTIVSIDPLNDEFAKILKVHNEKVKLLTADGESLPFENDTFDWVICWNVIDHTPHPELMTEELFRVLKPGGKLYFEVHFDDSLAPPHYELWNKETVSKYFGDKKLKFMNIFRNDAGNQSKCYAIYEK